MTKLKIAIQGVKGAFHEIAAQNYFGSNIELVECLTFRQLISAAGNGAADVGMMAVENSVAGTILPNFGLLMESNLTITGEIYLRIVQNLLALPGQKVANIVEVRSHPMALAQCQDYLQKQNISRLVETEDTALAAMQLTNYQIKGVGIIASKLAAKQYELAVVAEGIETNKENYTRFLILERSPKIHTNINKATICFSAKHEPGSLARVLSGFAYSQVNLTLIQSLPMVGRKWEYFFIADLTFHSYQNFESALNYLKRETSSIEIQGEYNQGKEIEGKQTTLTVHQNGN